MMKNFFDCIFIMLTVKKLNERKIREMKLDFM